MGTFISKYFVLSLLLLCFSLTSCRKARGVPDRYISRDVLPQEFLGGWKVSEQTLKIIQDKHGRASSFLKKRQYINLYENGSCDIEIFSNIPESLFTTPDYIDESYQCTWKLIKDHTWIGHNEAMVQLIEIVATQEYRKNDVPHKATIIINLFVAEKEGKLILWDFIGDPDSYNFRDFEKGKSTNRDRHP